MTTFTPRHVRRLILEQARRAGVGHIGSALSIVELLCALCDGPLRIASPTDPDRDRFVLSKGHAALAYYVILHLRGRLTRAELDTYCADDSALGVHPERRVAGIDFATGSMGMGLGFAAGAALAARLQASARRAFVLLSDGECNEGSVWEAAMFASHHRLANLTAIVDCNGQQAFGHTRDILAADALPARWAAFGWDVREVDGHDVAAIRSALAPGAGEGRPRVILARTVCGKGVLYMEGRIKWHYWPMTEAEYRAALAEVDGK